MELLEQFSWKGRIREIAESLGFLKVGFTGAQQLSELAHYLKEASNAGHFTPFVEQDIALRTDPQAVWLECKTVVVLAYPLPRTSPPQEREGILARSTVGEDYHYILKTRLEKLSQVLIEVGWPSDQIRFQVDTGSLNERGFAIRAGLGWSGRNQQLIIPGIGSFVALALVLLDQELPPDSSLANQCGNCGRCIQACPAQILGKEPFSANQCLSYLTQSKERLNDEQAKSLGQRLFGCDTCQEACPHNFGFLKDEEEETQPITEGRSHTRSESDGNCGGTERLSRGVDLYNVLTLTRDQFNERFRGTAAGWRGKGILQRNAYLVMVNLQDERRLGWLNENGKKDALPLVLRQELMSKD